MEKIIIICILIAIIALLLIVMVNQYNKFQLLIIKLNKGESSIGNVLEEKYNILFRFSDLLKNNIKVEKEDFDEFNLLNTKSSIYKVDKKIREMNNVINKYLDNNEKLLKNNSIIKINRELQEININLNGCKKYYNDNLVNYNHLCNAFPSKIIAKIYKYKEKDFIDEDMKDELKILSNNDTIVEEK